MNIIVTSNNRHRSDCLEGGNYLREGHYLFYVLVQLASPNLSTRGCNLTPSLEFNGSKRKEAIYWGVKFFEVGGDYEIKAFTGEGGTIIRREDYLIIYSRWFLWVWIIMISLNIYVCYTFKYLLLRMCSLSQLLLACVLWIASLVTLLWYSYVFISKNVAVRTSA